jgi:hypothetical protein
MAILKPGVPTAMFARLDEQFKLRGRMPVADALKRQAKLNATTGSHAYGTPTPSPGDPVGPATISRTLVNSIDRSEVTREVFGYLIQVGTAVGHVTPYGGAHARASTRYGYILEVEGCRNGRKFPFLYPAFKFAVDHVAPVIYKEKYGTGWARLI